MLILTRKIGQNLIIGTNVSVTVLEVKGNQVRVGVDAPKAVPVHREEIYLRIQKERELSKGIHREMDSPNKKGSPRT